MCSGVNSIPLLVSYIGEIITTLYLSPSIVANIAIFSLMRGTIMRTST